MSVSIVIPARFASTRYPGKPLVELKGADGVAKSLVQRSWEAALSVQGIDGVYVATDDNRIADACAAFGANVLMTSSSHRNGTERCAEAAELLGASGDDIVVNLQGDAPLTPAWFVSEIVAALNECGSAAMATPVLRCSGRMLASLKADRAAGRVGGTTAVFDGSGRALYFSKEVIPFTAKHFDADEETPVFHHVGVYAYRTHVLKEYSRWDEGNFEVLEGLEQLRFVENRQTVLCVEVEARGREFWELNNPSDVPVIQAMFERMGLS